jgi:hypothetical protein
MPAVPDRTPLDLPDDLGDLSGRLARLRAAARAAIAQTQLAVLRTAETIARCRAGGLPTLPDPPPDHDLA